VAGRGGHPNPKLLLPAPAPPGPLWRNIDLFWPRGIGQVVLVLDEGTQHWGRNSWCPLGFSQVREELFESAREDPAAVELRVGVVNHTTAPYVAIMDDDVILNLKVSVDECG